MSKGRPKKEPILPERVDPDNKKKNIKGQLYPAEWEVLKEKLEERGYSSIAEWIEDKAEDLILDRDLKERKKELERKIDSKKSDIEDLKGDLEDIKEKLGDREEKISEIREDIKEYIAGEVRTGKTPQGKIVTKELDEIAQKFDISYKDRQEVRKIYFQEKSKLYKGDIKEEDLPDRILNRWEEENIVTLGVGSG